MTSQMVTRSGPVTPGHGGAEYYYESMAVRDSAEEPSSAALWGQLSELGGPHRRYNAVLHTEKMGCVQFPPAPDGSRLRFAGTFFK